MQERTSFTAWLLPVVLALSAVCTADAFAAPPANTDIVVVSVRGDVLVTMAGIAREVSAGSVVTTPARIRTGRSGYIELRQGPTTASVASDSAIEIAASSSPDGLVERILQTQGNVLYDVGKRTGRKLRVETAYLVAVIKGTQFNVSAEIDSATVSLFEGRLEIWTPDATDFIDLNAGEIAARKRSDSSIRVLSLDTGETLRAQLEKPAEAPASAATSTAVPATTTDIVTPVQVIEQVASRPEIPETRVDTTSAVVNVDTTPPAANVETVAAAPPVTLTLDLLDDPRSSGKGPDGEGPPGQDRLDDSRGSSANAPGRIEPPNVAPAMEVTLPATAIDIVTVDVGESTISTPALPVVPVVEEVVKPLSGLLGR